MKSNEIGIHHVKQYDALFENGIINNVIANCTPLEYRGFRLVFEEIEIHKPFVINNENRVGNFGLSDKRLLPADCREQLITYGGSCFLKMKLMYRDQVLFDDFKPSGLFPVMVRSKLCHTTESKNLYKDGDDPRETGGYFIVNGQDKLLRFHIAYKRNHLFAIHSKSKDHVYSDYSVMIRSVGVDEIGQKNDLKYCTDGNIHMKVYVRKRIYYIPVVIILRALVNTTDEEIYKSLGCDKRILTLLGKMKSFEFFGQKSCLSYLGSRFFPVYRIDDYVECGKEFLRRIILVHLDSPEDKYNLLIEAIKKLLACFDKKIEPENIDLTSNHELFTETQLIALSIREKLDEIKRGFLNKIISIARSRVQTNDSTTSLNPSEILEIGDVIPEIHVDKIKHSFDLLDFNIGNKVKRLLSSGNITTMSCSDILQTTGWSVVAERINYWRFASHFESLSRGAFFTTLKLTAPRKLRPEGWGFICPINTPDGAPCGLLLHITRNTFITNISNQLNESILYDLGLVPILRGHFDGIPLYYNGRLSGSTKSPNLIVDNLRRYRSIKGLCIEICYEKGPGLYEAIYVYDNISRMMRKVVNLETGLEDWIGIKEQQFLNIKLAPYKTRDAYNEYDLQIQSEISKLEIKDSDQISQSSNSIIQNSDIVFKDFKYREISNCNIFSTVASCITFGDYNPSPRNIYQCQMAKQAMGISAFNNNRRTDVKTFQVNYLQTPIVKTKFYEDLKDFPIGFNCIVAVLSYTSYDMEDAVIINKSSSERGLFNAYVYKTEKFELQKSCYIEYTPFKGTVVEDNDVIVKYIDENTGPGVFKYSGGERGVVESVRIFNNGSINIVVTIRITRNPNTGDKFCSRHGQKGVMSMLWREIDMPFTEQGLRPDIIINPHAFPSRMTIGMLLESMCGKSGLSLGEFMDGTPFEKNCAFDESNKRSIGEDLKKCGFNYYGNEPMYSGITGSEFRTDIFIGCVYYQRLRHMVNDKFQVRTSGAVVATTRQPVGGRKNKGGIRFGEMERDALIAHGAAYTLRDRLMDCSDRTEFLYCGKCLTFLFTDKRGCVCGSSNLKKMELPYVFKYLACELMAMNIKLKIDI